MKSLIKDVSDFHIATDTPVRGPGYTRKGDITSEEKELRISLITEELKETTQALNEGDIVELADGVVDLMYVTAGTMAQVGVVVEDKPESYPQAVEALLSTCLEAMIAGVNKSSKQEIEKASVMFDVVCKGICYEYGIPFHSVWDEVHRSNMAKVDPTTGKVKKREDGKVLKPEGWAPPDVKGVLETTVLLEA